MLINLVVVVHVECLRHRLGQLLLVVITYALPGVHNTQDIPAVMDTGIVDKVKSYVLRT